ncbi:MAG: flavodoxin family protein [Candidatus Brocadiia bacterium]
MRRFIIRRIIQALLLSFPSYHINHEEAALDVFRDAGAEVETVVPRKLSISPCLSCNACFENGACVQQDQMQDLYVRFCEVDHVVVASPIYFTALPGHFKVMIDRFQCFWARTYLLGTPPEPRRTGMFLCIGAMGRERYYRSCLTTVKTWLSVLNMACPVSRFFPDLDARDDIETHGEYLDEARRAAEELLAYRLPQD